MEDMFGLRIHPRHTLLFTDTEPQPVCPDYPTVIHPMAPPVTAPVLGDTAPTGDPDTALLLCLDADGAPAWVPVHLHLLPLAQGLLRTVAHVDRVYRKYLPKKREQETMPRRCRAPTRYNAHISSTLKKLQGSDIPRPVRMKIACEEYRAFRAKQKEELIAACRANAEPPEISADSVSGGDSVQQAPPCSAEHSTCSAATAASPSIYGPLVGKS